MISSRSLIVPLLLLSIFFLLSAASSISSERDQKLRQCKEQCRRQQTEHHEQHQQEEEQRWRCEQRCEKEFGSRRGPENDDPIREKQEGRREQETTKRKNPFYFSKEESFSYIFKNEHGYVRALEKFHEHSELLLGIANYRVLVLEAEPHTFVMPLHCDADAILFVVRGRGAITKLRSGDEESKKETHDLREGDVMEVCAGDAVYMVNRDDNQRLVIAKLIRPVSVPGEVQAFFGPGGEDPESFYRSFSSEVLRAAFNAPREKLERLFGKQSKGAIFRASEEQIKALSGGGGGGGGGIWPPFGPGSRESGKPFNLLSRRPAHSSEHGKLFEAGADDYEPLRRIDIRVSFANITRGSMIAPFYNSRSTKVAIVTEGNGWTEMVCPHMGEAMRKEKREEERMKVTYERVRARLSRGDVFVVPPGHPMVAVASGERDLQMVCFDIRAEGNVRNFLAGKNNVLRGMEKEAKELAFDASADEVDGVLDAQRESVLLPGPEEEEEQHRRRQPLQSIVDFAGF